MIACLHYQNTLENVATYRRQQNSFKSKNIYIKLFYKLGYWALSKSKARFKINNKQWTKKTYLLNHETVPSPFIPFILSMIARLHYQNTLKKVPIYQDMNN